MEPVPESMRREVETFLSFVSGVESERAIEARTFHVTARYDDEDFLELGDRLAAANATGSFSILARDLDEQADVVAALGADGHEIALHGYRHTSFGEVSYETAHEELSTALDSFEDDAGVRPTGFHVPFMDASEGTLRAADELGIEWILGRTAASVPDGVRVIEPVSPWDSRLLEAGTSAAATFEQLGESADERAAFLCHPNLHEYYGANAAFDDWLVDHCPVSIVEMLDDGGVGLILDCVKPVRIE